MIQNHPSSSPQPPRNFAQLGARFDRLLFPLRSLLPVAPNCRQMRKPAQVEANTVLARRLFLVIFITGSLLRIGAAVLHSGPIENEGAGYARIAESLYFRQDYAGIAENPDLASPPGYPLLIAAAAPVTRNFVAAARIVSLLCGASLMLTFYLLGRELYNPAAGVACALVAAVHPFLIVLSAASYNEGPYFAFLMAAVYWTVRSLSSVTSRAWLWSAVFFGCAYLTRPEILPFPILAALLVLVSRIYQNRREGLLQAAGILLVFAGFLLPYVIFLQRHTGHFQVEARNLVNFTIGNRVLDGMDPFTSTRALGPNLEFEGPLLHTNLYASYSPYPATLRNLLRYFLRMAAHNKYWIYQNVLPNFAFGAPVLWCLLALGFFAEPWRRRAFLAQLLLMALFAYLIVTLLATHSQQLRYAFALVPLTLVWAGRGLVAVWCWATETALAIWAGSKAAKLFRWAVASGILAALVCFSTLGTGEVPEFELGRSADSPLRSGGLWLKGYAPGPKTVCSVTSILPFYAGGYQVLWPAADSNTVLLYLRSASPDFVVLGSLSNRFAAYLHDWYEHGIPDPRARLIHEERGAGETLRIYSWAWQRIQH